MNKVQLDAFAQFISFVRDVRDHYSWLADDDLVKEVASLLRRPVHQIDPLVRSALKFLREHDTGL